MAMAKKEGSLPSNGPRPWDGSHERFRYFSKKSTKSCTSATQSDLGPKHSSRYSGPTACSCSMKRTNFEKCGLRLIPVHRLAMSSSGMDSSSPSSTLGSESAIALFPGHVSMPFCSHSGALQKNNQNISRWNSVRGLLQEGLAFQSVWDNLQTKSGQGREAAHSRKQCSELF